MTVTLAPWEAWPLAALAVLGASTIASLTIAGAFTIRQRRAGGQPAPGAGKNPVPGSAVCPPAAPAKPGPGRPPVRPAPAPGQPRHNHGGDVRIIVVKGDGRVETTDCRSGNTEVIPGDCPACRDGHCSWCATYPAWDEARGRWVRRYQRCPAHQDKERQP